MKNHETKFVSAEQAVQAVQSGDWVALVWGE